MRRLNVLILVLALAGGLAAGCGGGDKAVPDDSVAVVGDQEITKAEYDALIDRAKRNYQQNNRPFPKAGTPEYRQLQNQAVQYLVQQAKYEQKADEMDVKVTDKEVDARVNQIKQQYFQGKDELYEKNLRQQGITDAQVRRDVRNQLISEKIYQEVTGEVKVSDEEIAEYYAEHKKDYRQAESRDVRHILVGPTQRALANRVHAQLKAGASFAQLARKHTKDTVSKASGGKLTITRGQTVPEFDKTAFALRKNEISRPVKTRFGFHIIQALSDVRAAKTTPLKDVKEQIRQQLLQSKRQKAIADWSKDVNKDFEDEIAYQVGYAPPTTNTTATTDR